MSSVCFWPSKSWRQGQFRGNLEHWAATYNLTFEELLSLLEKFVGHDDELCRSPLDCLSKAIGYRRFFSPRSELLGKSIEASYTRVELALFNDGQNRPPTRSSLPRTQKMSSPSPSPSPLASISSLLLRLLPSPRGNDLTRNWMCNRFHACDANQISQTDPG